MRLTVMMGCEERKVACVVNVCMTSWVKLLSAREQITYGCVSNASKKENRCPTPKKKKVFPQHAPPNSAKVCLGAFNVT